MIQEERQVAAAERRKPRQIAFALGIDPGPVTGVALLHLGGIRLADGAEVFQCGIRSAPWLLGALLASLENREPGCKAASLVRGGIEAFAAGRGAGARMRAGRATAGQVERLASVALAWGIPLAQRNAGTVKPWAEGNDSRRLRVSGLLALVPGMPHAKSALGQALYAACHDAGYPDPLRRAGSKDEETRRRESDHAPGSPSG
jgi:hypothetical protein